jgi:hypothetical protein
VAQAVAVGVSRQGFDGGRAGISNQTSNLQSQRVAIAMRFDGLQSGRNRILEKYFICGHDPLYPATASQTADERFKRHILFFVVKQKGVKIGRLVRERQPNCLVDDL